MTVQDEIERVKEAIRVSNSKHLKRDYGKYLKKLERMSKQFEKTSTAERG